MRVKRRAEPNSAILSSDDVSARTVRATLPLNGVINETIPFITGYRVGKDNFLRSALSFRTPSRLKVATAEKPRF
ncbi:hypothetical protein SODG_003855 [Sodalis praecaptivus]